MSSSSGTVGLPVDVPADDELESQAESLVPDLPSGPLDVYRKKASFDWKKLKVVLDGKENIELENKIWKFLKEDPIFHHPKHEQSFDEFRRLTFLRMKRLIQYREAVLPEEDILRVPSRHCTLIRCLGMYEWSVYVKMTLTDMVFKFGIVMSGDKRHAHFVNGIYEKQFTGSLVLTELAHGSNLRGLSTTATYDPSTQEFVMHTPSVEATKCWVGNLGKHATHGMVYAQLYTPDGQCQGLHIFVVPIRDPTTHHPYPGVVVGDMGPKAGLDGIDNGFLSFHHYHIPRDCLLNRVSDVTPEGKYVTRIKDDTKRFSSALATLSAGRIGIIRMCATNQLKALIIAIRYSCARKQFGPSNDEEVPVMEYQLQQWRLIPLLAAGYAMDIYSRIIIEQFQTLNLQTLLGKPTNDRKKYAADVHAIGCSVKPLASWLARDTIQECREACGGHGYLKIAGLGDLRNDHDANCTYEGDSHVLLQQTSNYLLYLWKCAKAGEEIVSPLGCCSFLKNYESIPQRTLSVVDVQDVWNVETILEAYEWLICYLLQESEQKLQEELSCGLDQFSARNNCQAYYLRSVALAFAEYTVLQGFYNYVKNPALPRDIGTVLRKLCSLYGVWSLEKHLSTLYQGAYVSGPSVATIMRKGVLRLCADLKDDAVSLVDVVAPPDHVLNSALGAADGQIYKNIYNALVHRPGAFEIPKWWNELKEAYSKDGPQSLSSKL